MINSTAFDYVNVLTKAADVRYPGLQAQGFKF